jgi:hypothetical protein
MKHNSESVSFIAAVLDDLHLLFLMSRNARGKKIGHVLGRCLASQEGWPLLNITHKHLHTVFYAFAMLTTFALTLRRNFLYVQGLIKNGHNSLSINSKQAIHKLRTYVLSDITPCPLLNSTVSKARSAPIFSFNWAKNYLTVNIVGIFKQLTNFQRNLVP